MKSKDNSMIITMMIGLGSLLVMAGLFFAFYDSAPSGEQTYTINGAVTVAGTFWNAEISEGSFYYSTSKSSIFNSFSMPNPNPFQMTGTTHSKTFLTLKDQSGSAIKTITRDTGALGALDTQEVKFKFTEIPEGIYDLDIKLVWDDGQETKSFKIYVN